VAEGDGAVSGVFCPQLPIGFGGVFYKHKCI